MAKQVCAWIIKRDSFVLFSLTGYWRDAREQIHMYDLDCFQASPAQRQRACVKGRQFKMGCVFQILLLLSRKLDLHFNDVTSELTLSSFYYQHLPVLSSSPTVRIMLLVSSNSLQP